MAFSFFFPPSLSFQIADRKVPCETAYLKIPGWKSTRFVPLNSWRHSAAADPPPPLTFWFALTWPRWKEATTGEAQEIHHQQKPCVALKCAIESQNSATLFSPRNIPSYTDIITHTKDILGTLVHPAELPSKNVPSALSELWIWNILIDHSNV